MSFAQLIQVFLLQRRRLAVGDARVDPRRISFQVELLARGRPEEELARVLVRGSKPAKVGIHPLLVIFEADAHGLDETYWNFQRKADAAVRLVKPQLRMKGRVGRFIVAPSDTDPADGLGRDWETLGFLF